MTSTVSVSKGVFVFKNGAKSANKKSRRKASVPSIEGDSLWYQNFKTLWGSIEHKLEELNHSVFSNVLQSLVAFIKQSYEHQVLEIPTAALLLGINMPDHNTQFSTLSRLLREQVTPHVAVLHSEDCQSVKWTMEHLIRQLVVQEDLEDAHMDEDEECAGQSAVKVKRNQCNVAFLQSWYEDLYPEGGCQKIVVIFPDFESMPTRIVQDFILITSSYLNILPFVLVFGVATSLSTLHQSLPYHVSNKVNIHVFHTPSSTHFLNNTLENILLTAECPFQLGARVFNLFTDIFLFYDFSVSGFVTNLKYALLEHCSYGNAMALCTMDNVTEVLKQFTHEDYENVRRLMSFRWFVEAEVDAEKQLKLLTDDGYLRKVLKHHVQQLTEFIKKLHLFTRCLHALVYDLPNAPLGKQIRELYSQVVLGKITQTKTYRECFQVLAYHNSSEFCKKIQSVIDILSNNNTSEETNDIIAALKTQITEIKSHREKNEESEDLAQNPVKRQQFRQNLENMSKSRNDSKCHIKTLDYLTGIFAEHLVNPATLPFHEIFFFNDISIKNHIIGSHRAAIHTALNDPHFYLQCECCKTNSTGQILQSMPDLSIVYKLHLECGKVINLYDWLQAFISILDPQDVEDSSKCKVRPELQARFTQAVAELQFLGFIKSSKRKIDHVTRLTWGG